MRYTIYNLNEITDSKELLQSRPHTLISIITCTIILIIISIFFWSYFSEIDIVVKSNGIVKSSSEITVISNKVVGQVGTVNYRDGDEVKEGDILYTLNHKSLTEQKDLIEKSLEIKSLDLENMVKLRNSIADDKSYFDNVDDSDNKYVNIYKKYKIDLNGINNNLQLNKNELDSIQNKITNLNLLLKSINDNKNYFNDSSSYSNEYKDYELTIQQYKFKVNEARNLFEKLTNEGGNNNDIEQARVNLNAIENDMNLYINKTELNIKTLIEQNSAKFEDMQKNSTLSSLSNNGRTVESAKLGALVQVDADIDKLKYEIDEVKNKLQILNNSINDYLVRSPSNGVIKLVNEVSKGDILQIGVKVAEILPESSPNYKVELYISQLDIGKIKKGQNLKIKFLAFQNKEYKYMEGKIDFISQDSFINKDNGSSYYIAEATINNDELIKYSSKEVDIKLGMVCETKIVTAKKKTLYYLLEKFDFINNIE